MNRPIVKRGVLTGLKWWLVVLLVLWCCSAFAAAPVARIGSNIDEQSIIEPGDPLEFEADSLTEKERCKWKVIPAFSQTGKPTYKLSGDKRVLTVFSRSGTYSITLYVWTDEDMAETVKTITVGKPTVIVGPTPVPPITPKPNEPVDPGGTRPDPLPVPLGLDKVIANAVRLNVPASERPFAVKLAENYRIVATSLTTDEAKKEWQADPAAAFRKAIKTAADTNSSTPGYKEIIWRPVFKDIANALGEARAQGNFSTQKHIVAAFAEMSVAFSEVAK